MITPTQLEYLLAVDTHRHFGNAAKASFVTQPTLSMQLQKLEEELGTMLFDRDKKPILPTEAGKKIIAQARLILSELQKLKTLGQISEDEISGELKLAVIPTLAPYLIPLFLKKFADTCPKLETHLQEMQTDAILEALEHDQIDGALLATPLGVSTLIEEPLFYEPFKLYLPRKHPLAGQQTVQEDDLEGSQIWLLEEGHCLRNQVIRICSMRKQRPVLKNVRFESGNLETLKRLVESGEGYTLLPALALHQAAIPKKMTALPFAAPVPSREISLVYRREHLRQKALQTLCSVIRSVLPAGVVEMEKKKVSVTKI